MEEATHTTYDRLHAFTRPEIYRMVPVQLGLLIPMVLLIALLAHWVDTYLQLPPISFVPLNYILCALLMGLSAAIVYWSYTYLVLEGDGSPSPGLKKTTRIVTTGPYAFVRHPTVLGKLVGIIGVGLLFRSATFLFFVVPLLAIAATISNRVDQEPTLERMAGDMYRQYRQRVPMIFPAPRDLWSLLMRARHFVLSVLLIVAAVYLVGPGEFYSKGLWPPHFTFFWAAGVFWIVIVLEAFALRPALPNTPFFRLLGFASGHEFIKNIIRLQHRDFGEVVRRMFGRRSGAVFLALSLERAANLWILGTALALGLGWLAVHDEARVTALVLLVGGGLLSFLAWMAGQPLIRPRVQRSSPFQQEDLNLAPGLDGVSRVPAGPAFLYWLSFLQLGLTLAAYSILYSLIGASVPLATVAGIFPLVIFFSRLPFFYNRIGSQDLAMIVLLETVGVAPGSALALSLLVHLARIPLQLLEGAFFLTVLSRWQRS